MKSILHIIITLVVFSIQSQATDNLQTCMSGKYPSLCDYSQLSPEQRVMVKEAERQENLKTCLTGKYPSLCNYSLLSENELKEVQKSERTENLKICLDGNYPSLCKYELLTQKQKSKAKTAESRAKKNQSKLQRPMQHTNIAPTSGECHEAFIQKPTPFLGNGEEIIILDDGTIWEDFSYQYLYLYEYNPSVIICPNKGKMILDEYIFSVQRIR